MSEDRAEPARFRAARRAFAAALLLGLAATGVVLGLRAFRERVPGNPYALDLADYKKIDPALIGFEETASFDVPLESLRALAVEEGDRILVGGDGGGPALLRFEPGAREPERIPLPALPHCLAPGPAGEIYVGTRDRIVVLRPGEPEPETWTGLGEQAFLTAIAADEKDVFAADGGQRLVWRFDPRGGLKSILGKKDEKAGEAGFLVPGPCFDLALSPGGALWVVNPGRHRVQHRARDGRVLSSWGIHGFEIEGFGG
jgi:hypothetical protein